jgi:antitoxin (DNA-binding transcriptional repressor) of toxin-antitoxin stability system
MSNHTISATQASRTFSKILNKVHYQGESYDIKRGKEVIAKIVPATAKKSILKVSELNKLFKRLPSLESGDEEIFKKDLEQIRAQMNTEGNPWD